MPIPTFAQPDHYTDSMNDEQYEEEMRMSSMVLNEPILGEDDFLEAQYEERFYFADEGDEDTLPTFWD